MRTREDSPLAAKEGSLTTAIPPDVIVALVSKAEIQLPSITSDSNGYMAGGHSPGRISSVEFRILSLVTRALVTGLGTA